VGAQAAGADLGAHGLPADAYQAHLEIRQEATVRANLRVAHVVSVLRAFAADCAFSSHEVISELGSRRRVGARKGGDEGELYHRVALTMPAAEQQQKPSNRVLQRAREKGRIEVFPDVVAALAGHAASSCYGVMGMSARGLRDGVAELLRRGNLHRGVDVREAGGRLVIDVYVIVQYGTRITEVAHNLQSTVRFEVERLLGVPVGDVNVFVQGVHEDRVEH